MAKDKFIEKMEKECKEDNHKFSEWIPFDDLEDTRNCIFCSETEYKF